MFLGLKSSTVYTILPFNALFTSLNELQGIPNKDKTVFMTTYIAGGGLVNDRN